MSQVEQLARALVERTWAMRDDSLRAVADLLRSGAVRSDDGDGDGGQAPSWSVVRGQQPRAASGSVAIVPIQGVIRPHGSLLEMLFGLGGGLATIRQSLSEAAADDSVGAIVLDVDSPGGVVDGVPETADQIRRIRSDKPVVAAVNTQAASAAYWLASQATEVVATPSGSAGSIGVFVVHENIQGLLQAEGVELSLIVAGRFKAEANPWEPLDDEARGHLQDTVDRYYAMFTGDVAKGRDVARSDVTGGFGEGRMLLARPAVDEGLADRVGTIDDAIARAAKLAGSGSGRRPRSQGLAAASPDGVREQFGLDPLASAVGPHSTDTSEGDWDGAANEQRLRTGEEPAYYRRAYAWGFHDRDGTAKSHWRFIHHDVSEDGEPDAANLRGCRAAIAILNGGRGVDPRQQPWWEDRSAIHRHLAAHLRDADEDPPPLEDLDEESSDGGQQVELSADDLARPWVRDLLAGRVPAGPDDHQQHEGDEPHEHASTGSGR